MGKRKNRLKKIEPDNEVVSKVDNNYLTLFYFLSGGSISN